MVDNSSANKTIAKNTVVLYIKLIISIIISFISTRLILQILGASDYGLFNVVGGIVSMLNVLGTAMIATSDRYMAVEIGKGKDGNPNKVYNTVLVVHLLIACFLILLGESLGVYYVNNYLNVEPGRINDALFVLHFSLITTAINVITIPSNGLIIAREKFVFTSIVEIVHHIFKLGCVILLLFIEADKLRAYAIINAISQSIMPISYFIYCRIKDKAIVEWNFNKNWDDYKNVMVFAFWIFIGAISSIAKTQGAAMIINVFYGTVLNAAFGLASQVYGYTSQFTTTLRQAVIPQIMKGQSSGNEDRSLNLVYKISKYCYLFMLVPAIPIMICINGVLIIWLGTPPEYTSIFIVLMLINGMVTNLCTGFDAAIQATGKIRKNQIVYCLTNVSLLPIIYILYKLGFPPYMNVITMILLSVIILLFQCGIMKQLTNFNIAKYIRETVVPALLSTALAVVPLLFLIQWCNATITHTICGAFICMLWTFVSIYLLGLNNKEKTQMKMFIRTKIHR